MSDICRGPNDGLKCVRIHQGLELLRVKNLNKEKEKEREREREREFAPFIPFPVGALFLKDGAKACGSCGLDRVRLLRVR